MRAVPLQARRRHRGAATTRAEWRIDMISIPDSTLPQFDRPFRLFATEKRVLAQNAVGKLIDIGAIEHLHDGHCAIHLDVDAINTGPQPNPQSALRTLVPKLNFDYLDGLFTAEANARFDGRPDMTDVTDTSLGSRLAVPDVGVSQGAPKAFRHAEHVAPTRPA
ncbi:unnamed protein product (plasmid) [Mycetohabitans rhizoxinica HKI 454]|uniref:Uncharacterized protein n=2 Tax=Burkholderiaceae TaxID=119060 RepID=E5AUT9_MYCRK|nr:unnamed protein product [Mycetohabitans rhizoxinica HKI 454]